MSFEEFKKLMIGWHNDTGGYSTYKHIMQHPSYEKIKNMDKETAIRYTCVMLGDNCTIQCFIVLGDMVDPDKKPPFDRYYAGRVPVMLECWRCWALHQKIVSTKYDLSGYWVEDKECNKGNWS